MGRGSSSQVFPRDNKKAGAIDVVVGNLGALLSSGWEEQNARLTVGDKIEATLISVNTCSN